MSELRPVRKAIPFPLDFGHGQDDEKGIQLIRRAVMSLEVFKVLSRSNLDGYGELLFVIVGYGRSRVMGSCEDCVLFLRVVDFQGIKVGGNVKDRGGFIFITARLCIWKLMIGKTNVLHEK